jgi:enhancing lycopene biosynthesis protein 2
MSVDAKTMSMIFSGTGVYDSFNVIKATLTLSNAT